MENKIKTSVRCDQLNLLIVGIRRALNLYDGDLNIKLDDDYLQIGDKNTGEVCQIKLSENVDISEKERLVFDAVDIGFLKSLGKEMREQENDCQASPRYWTVGDYEDRIVPDGYGNGVKFVFPGVCDESTEEGALELLKEYDYDEVKLEELKDDLSLLGDHDDLIEALQEWVDEDAYIITTDRVHIIEPNTVFLTKQEAKDHIAANYYHYTKEAHTYAMTAWRAPKVRRLFEILEKLGE